MHTLATTHINSYIFIGSFITEDGKPSQVQATLLSTLSVSVRLTSQLRKGNNNKLAKARKKFLDEHGIKLCSLSSCSWTLSLFPLKAALSRAIPLATNAVCCNSICNSTTDGKGTERCSYLPPCFTLVSRQLTPASQINAGMRVSTGYSYSSWRLKNVWKKAKVLCYTNPLLVIFILNFQN